MSIENTENTEMPRLPCSDTRVTELTENTELADIQTTESKLPDEPDKPKKQKKQKKTKKSVKKGKTLSVKFIKLDKYKNPIFLVANDSEDTRDSYLKVKSFYKNLRKNYKTNLPFFLEKKKKFATIRFKKAAKHKFKALALYEITFTFHETTKDSKTYCNLMIQQAKLTKEHDHGKEIEVESDCDDTTSSDESESESE